MWWWLAATPTEAQEQGDTGVEQAAGPSDPASDGFLVFLERFRAAVASRDREATADLTRFPFTSYDLVGRLPADQAARQEPQGPVVLDRQAFIEAWPYLFDKKARAGVARRGPVAVDGGYGIGIWSGKSWSAWLQFYRDDTGEWHLVGTRNVSG